MVMRAQGGAAGGTVTTGYPSNMRSAVGGQQVLPFDVLPAAASDSNAPVSGAPEPGVTPDAWLRIRLRTDVLASRGWVPGTELVVERGRRPRRGEVTLVRVDGRARIGVFDLHLGRGALRTDHGTSLLGSSVTYLGVVTLAAPPLAGMPDPSA